MLSDWPERDFFNARARTRWPFSACPFFAPTMDSFTVLVDTRYPTWAFDTHFEL